MSLRLPVAVFRICRNSLRSRPAGYVHTEFVFNELCIEIRDNNFGQVTPNIFVNDNSAIGEKDPSVATPDGGIVVTYTANDAEISSYMRAAIFNGDGSVRKADFLLSAFTGEALSQSEVVGLPNGNWAVVFTSSAWDEGGTLGTGITLQIRDPNGVNITPGLVEHVNAPSKADESDADITMLANGFILVTWTRELSVTDHDIYGRVFDLSGNPVTIDGNSGQFVITFNGTDDRYSAVSRLINGRFVAAWQDFEGDGQRRADFGAGARDTRTQDGDGASNTITGDALRDTINGFGGNDILDGRGAADTMVGASDDDYYVDHAQDVIIDNAVRAQWTGFSPRLVMRSLLGLM